MSAAAPCLPRRAPQPFPHGFPAAGVHTVNLSMPCPSPAVAKAACQALLVEAEAGPEGARMTVREDDGVLHVSLEAADISTLRAALNSATRLAQAAVAAASIGVA
jgi:tRNA threonylcarbamoyladenosine modification (KEOPS) complex  Pcc1 subunit